LFRIITTLLLPDSGNVNVCGYDAIKDYKKIRTITGYMPGRFSLYHDLTVEENLNFYATIFNTTIEKNYHLIKDIYYQIEPFKKRPAGKLSGGMKQKLALSCALIHQPEILVLDEPTTGVDAVSRKEFWEILKNLQSKGVSIIVSTPYMDEAEICNKVALMQNGNILSLNTPDDIIKNFSNHLIAVKAKNMNQLLWFIKQYKKYNIEVNIFGEHIHVSYKNNIQIKEDIQQYLINNKIEDLSISDSMPNIEDCFIELIKNQL
jgi:ABC-2 type transport system ATP-binding protein